MGPRVAEFEAAFADVLRRPRTPSRSRTAPPRSTWRCSPSSCGPGDEVVLPSLNFVAAANAIVHTGATPVFCDIVGEDDLNLDPADLEAAIGPRTKAIVVLHYGGFPCDMDAVLATRGAPRHRRRRGRGARAGRDAGAAERCGTLGAIGCFSFFSNKNLPVGEGGMVVTDDDELAERVRLLRSHGMTTLTWDRHRGHAQQATTSSRGVQLPARRDPRGDGARPARAAAEAERAPARASPRATGDAARRRRRHRRCRSRPSGPGRSSAHHLAVVLLPEGVERERGPRGARRRADPDERPLPADPRVHGRTAAPAPRPLPRTDAVAERLLTLPLYPAPARRTGRARRVAVLRASGRRSRERAQARRPQPT